MADNQPAVTPVELFRELHRQVKTFATASRRAASTSVDKNERMVMITTATTLDMMVSCIGNTLAKIPVPPVEPGAPTIVAPEPKTGEQP